MFIWLKDGAEEKLEALKEQGVIGDVKVEVDNDTRKKYIPTYEDLLDPTAKIPSIPIDLVEKVTHREIIYRGFRTEGVYRHEDSAEMLVKTDQGNGLTYQAFRISASSVEALYKIYTLVRQGKLAPAENWEAEETTVLLATDLDEAKNN